MRESRGRSIVRKGEYCFNRRFYSILLKYGRNRWFKIKKVLAVVCKYNCFQYDVITVFDVILADTILLLKFVTFKMALINYQMDRGVRGFELWGPSGRTRKKSLYKTVWGLRKENMGETKESGYAPDT